ncbi:hypothetical protein H8K90_05460 [Winogradskyella echinorum]|uniref:Lipoprotein n=1 Tax=Winogradskyella echinorum TaxID=538189 RepID=A0ABR6XZ88_9FLAO|nr:hypothetical protein [Winogradskyella echinorum]MBC3845815.1 hypothetical protein [Winogradskyella echinorum]MBC5750163.1 hypothetical protein [Winogradskyella echinorum]
MKRVFNISLLLFSLTLFTSCFEVLEEISLNADGSGKMLVTFNLSKSKSKIASIMLLDSVNGHKVPSKEDIGKALKEAKNHLKTINGITNINTTTDYDNYIFTISCDFTSIDNLDSVFKDLISKHNKKSKTNFSTSNFSFNSSINSFKRSFSYDNSIKRNFNKLNSEDRKIFEGANYTSIYRFKNDVKEVSNTNAKISPNKKAVFLKVDVMSLILGKKSISNTIKLSK